MSPVTRRTLFNQAAAAGAAGSLLAMLAACGGTGSSGEVLFQTSAGTRFGTPNKFLISNFNDDNDFEIEMTTVPVQNYFPKLSTEVASSSKAIDCFTSITNLMYSFARNDKVVAFDEVLPKGVIDDLVNDISPRYLDTWRYEGKLYGLPNDANAQWSFYRKDMFDEAGVELPASWEDAVDVAKELTGGDVYGYTASLRRGEYAGAHFSSVFFSYGGEYWDKDFKPTIDSDAGHKAIQVMLDLMPYADPGSINAGEDDTAQVLASGTAAWAPLEWGRADLTDPKENEVADQMETAVPPMGGSHEAAPCLGGQAYMIASWSDKQDDAAKYIEYATSSKVMPGFVKHGGQPARSSALTDPQNVKVGRYFPTLEKVLAQGHPFPAIPESFELLVALGNNVADIMTESISPDEGLKKADEQFAKTLQEGGYGQ